MRTLGEKILAALKKHLKELASKENRSYLGTVIDEKWWRRYTKDKLFMQGNGRYWHDNEGFYFLRYLTRTPIFIPFDKIIETKIVKWHWGKWIWGYPILKIIWMKNGLRLSSGFFVSKKEEDVMMLKNILDIRVKGL